MAESEQESGDLDFKRVIEKSTSEVALSDLQRKGFKQVKVLNRKVIFQLIAEAVDGVIMDRRQQISEEERGKYIQESKAKFDAMAKERLQVQQELAELRHFKEQALAHEQSTIQDKKNLEQELQQYQQKVQQFAQVEEELRRSQEQIRNFENLESELKQSQERVQKYENLENEVEQFKEKAEQAQVVEKELGEVRTALEQAQQAAEQNDNKFSDLQNEVSQKQEEANRNREELLVLQGRLEASEAKSADFSESLEKSRTEFRELLTKKTEAENLLEKTQSDLESSEEEVEKLKESLEEAELKLKEQEAQRADIGSQQLTMALLSKLGENSAQNSEMSQLQSTLEGLANKIAMMGSGGGGGGSFGPAVDANIDMERLFAVSAEESGLESNVSKVEVKESKAGGVKNTLAKLKALQQGGAKDGE